jgi:hypothetical protein
VWGFLGASPKSLPSPAVYLLTISHLVVVAYLLVQVSGLAALGLCRRGSGIAMAVALFLFLKALPGARPWWWCSPHSIPQSQALPDFLGKLNFRHR